MSWLGLGWVWSGEAGTQRAGRGMEAGNPELSNRGWARRAKPWVPFSLTCVGDPEAQRQDEALWSDPGAGGELSPFKKSL